MSTTPKNKAVIRTRGTPVVTMAALPRPHSIWKHLVYRKTINETTEFLIDFWGGRAVFDPNPVKAKITGYAWSLASDAVRKLKDVERECEISGLRVVLVCFCRRSDGTWEMVNLV